MCCHAGRTSLIHEGSTLQLKIKESIIDPYLYHKHWCHTITTHRGSVDSMSQWVRVVQAAIKIRNGHNVMSDRCIWGKLVIHFWNIDLLTDPFSILFYNQFIYTLHRLTWNMLSHSLFYSVPRLWIHLLYPVGSLGSLHNLFLLFITKVTPECFIPHTT